MENLKKFTFIFIATLLLGGMTETLTSQTTFGAKGGLNLSNLSIEDASDKNMVAGFHAGFFANMPVAGNFSIQPELLYSQKGTKWTTESSLADSEVKLKLNYLEVPVNLVFNLTEDFDFQLGPYVGYLLNANGEGQVVYGSGSFQTKDELDKENFNAFDFGLQGGMRFFLKPVYLGFNYKLGLSQVAKENEIWETILDDAANRTIQVYLGIPF